MTDLIILGSNQPKGRKGHEGHKPEPRTLEFRRISWKILEAVQLIRCVLEPHSSGRRTQPCTTHHNSTHQLLLLHQNDALRSRRACGCAWPNWRPSTAMRNRWTTSGAPSGSTGARTREIGPRRCWFKGSYAGIPQGQVQSHNGTRVGWRSWI